MKFAVKLKHQGQPARWDFFDDPRVTSHLDAFAFGKVMAEYWNNDLKPGETVMKILNAQVLGKGRARQPLVTLDGQMDWLQTTHSRRMQ